MSSFQGDFLVFVKSCMFKKKFKGSFQGVSQMIREGSHV